MFPDIKHFPYFAYDTETTGLNWPVDRMFSFSISLPNGEDYYYDIRQTPKAGQWLSDQCHYYSGNIICHNASFDYRMSSSAGINLPITQLDDTVIRACCIDEHLKSYELDYLSKKYLGVGKDTTIYEELAHMFGGLATRNVQIARIKDAPIDVAGKYAKLDTRRTLELWEWQRDEIARQGIEKIIKFERDLMPIFIKTEMRGIRVDLDYAEQAMGMLAPIIEEEQAKLNKIFGREVNVNSPKQIKEVFNPVQNIDGSWQTSDGTPIGTTPGGGPSINADILRGMDHPAARGILEIRSLIKTRDTFLAKHVCEHASGGRVYPGINQSKGEEGGTGTGRISYVNPAMQQIPSRNKKVAAIVKPAFLPEEGHVWVDADESSFEVRVFAHLVNNREIVNAYREDPELDFHQFTADITGLVRNATYSGQPNAKQLNLSMIFNSGNGAIAQKMGMPWSWDEFQNDKGEVIRYKKPGNRAKAVIDKYHRRIPGIKTLAEGCKKKALSRGYVFTFTGRRLRFPNGYKAYKASGLLIQSTSADLNKENWKIIDDTLEDGHMILNTHDSYSLSLPEDTWEEQFANVKREMDKPRIRVPLILELSGHGKNWWDAICK